MLGVGVERGDQRGVECGLTFQKVDR
jgi:hypothetical protein